MIRESTFGGGRKLLGFTLLNSLTCTGQKIHTLLKAPNAEIRGGSNITPIHYSGLYGSFVFMQIRTSDSNCVLTERRVYVDIPGLKATVKTQLFVFMLSVLCHHPLSKLLLKQKDSPAEKRRVIEKLIQ